MPSLGGPRRTAIPLAPRGSRRRVIGVEAAVVGELAPARRLPDPDPLLRRQVHSVTRPHVELARRSGWRSRSCGPEILLRTRRQF